MLLKLSSKNKKRYIQDSYKKKFLSTVRLVNQKVKVKIFFQYTG